jgi:phage protein D
VRQSQERADEIVRAARSLADKQADHDLAVEEHRTRALDNNAEMETRKAALDEREMAVTGREDVADEREDIIAKNEQRVAALKADYERKLSALKQIATE